MSLVQRVTFVAVPLLMLASFGWLLFINRPDDFQAVSYGKSFSASELAAAEQALQRAGLTNFRKEGRRLLAPARQMDQFNA
ncbi:MAG: hypothetical protein FJ267_12095, partial [Planctomycetes bacterium]|nr:hypothetical protein [Planctomycetota bacterium]